MEKNKFKLKIFPLAQLDLEQIFNYIAIDLCNPTAANGLIDEFENAFKTVCEYPQSCPRVNNEYVRDSSLRKLIINSYIAFYRITDTEIQVIRVLYGMRDFKDLL